MDLSDSQYDEMVLLSTGRWNPRVGKSKQAAKFLERIAIAWFIVLIFGGWILEPLLGAYADLFGLGLLLSFLIPAFWFRWKRRQLQARVIEHAYFLCPWCQYVLTGLEETGLCPECGYAYEQTLCKALYKSAYASIQPAPKDRERVEWKSWRRAILLRDGMIEPVDWAEGS